jgi:8-oxo-dGTP pyrophosphatase MutT (NUDIX family)
VALQFTEAALRGPLQRHLGTRDARRLPAGLTSAAAVLVPLFEYGGQTHVWLARRPMTMRSHAGQVAFPGGKVDPADGTLLDTALRETHEELGIARERVSVLGALDDVRTITGFTVSPWVGWLAPDTTVTPNPHEVARAFAAPLSAFFAPPSGIPPFRGWTVDGEHVWGATAAIVRSLVAIVREVGQGAGG